MTAADEVEARIAAVDGWRGQRLAQVRALIHKADPDVTESIKWRKASNPGGVPVWSHGSIICTGETYADKIKLTFMAGASLPDPHGLLNASTSAGTRRAIDLRETDRLNTRAFIALIRAAVELNEG